MAFPFFRLQLLNENMDAVAKITVEQFSIDPQKAINLDKRFTKGANSPFAGYGLMTLLTELLFQVLMNHNVSQVIGEVDADNIASILARLHVKDIIEGGFFQVSAKKLPKKNGFAKERYELSTQLRKPKLSRPVHFGEEDKDTFMLQFLYCCLQG